MLFYHDNTVDVSYKVQVDNMISVVFHNNHRWHLMLRDNAHWVLDYFQLSGVIYALYILAIKKAMNKKLKKKLNA